MERSALNPNPSITWTPGVYRVGIRILYRRGLDDQNRVVRESCELLSKLLKGCFRVLL